MAVLFGILFDRLMASLAPAVPSAKSCECGVEYISGMSHRIIEIQNSEIFLAVEHNKKVDDIIHQADCIHDIIPIHEY